MSIKAFCLIVVDRIYGANEQNRTKQYSSLESPSLQHVESTKKFVSVHRACPWWPFVCNACITAITVFPSLFRAEFWLLDYLNWVNSIYTHTHTCTHTVGLWHFCSIKSCTRLLLNKHCQSSVTCTVETAKLLTSHTPTHTHSDTCTVCRLYGNLLSITHIHSLSLSLSLSPSLPLSLSHTHTHTHRHW